MDVWVIGFITAYLSALRWTALLSIPNTLLLFSLGCLLLGKLRSCKTKPYLLFASGILFGITWIASVGHWTYFWQQSLTQTREQVMLTGQVSEVVNKDNTSRFLLRVEQYQQHRWRLYQPKVRLNWYHNTLPLADGDRVQLSVKLKPIRGLANEAGFDYQTWLFSRGIHARGYVVASNNYQKLGSDTGFRQRYLQRFYGLNLPQGRWLAALTFGERSQLAASDWLLVQKTGIAHLIAISGLHLGLVASLAYAVSLLLFRCAYYWCTKQNQNLHTWAIVVSLVASLFYAALAGFSVPTVRAWLMMLIGVCLLLFHRHWLFKRFFLFSLWLFILLFPLSPFGLSFWFSFAAILCLGFIFWRWPLTNGGFNLQNWGVVMLRIQLGLSILILPLVGWQFAMLSLLAPLVNLVAVPLVTLLLVPICLFAVLCLILELEVAYELFLLADVIVAYSLQGLGYILAQAPMFTTLPGIPLGCWLLLVVCLVICLLPFQHRLKYCCFLLCFPSLSYLLPSDPPGWRLDVLDVGQGLSVLLSKSGQTYLYDTGSAYPGGFNMAEAVSLPVLKSRNIQRLNTLVLSHDDNDHAGSYAMLKANMPIGQTISSRDFCVYGHNFSWSGLNVRVLWPSNAVKPEHRVDNDNSCVLHISDGDFSVLLPGDISKDVEQQLVERYGAQLKAQVLIAAHHGSNTSTSDRFLANVQPEYVIFSQGFMNRWGFPKADVVKRVETHGAKSLTTSTSGQISFFIQGEHYTLRRFRQDRASYWYAN